jgi:hypothetical protein
VKDSGGDDGGSQFLLHLLPDIMEVVRRARWWRERRTRSVWKRPKPSTHVA